METRTISTVSEQVVSLLHEDFCVPFSLLTPEQWDTPLTCKEIGLNGFGMACLFFEVEKMFGKTFETSVLNDYGFATINKITKAIQSS